MTKVAKKSQVKQAEKPTCWRCTRRVTLTVARVCPRCQKPYHARCYLAETGIEESANKECVCCLSSVLDDDAIRAAAKTNKYAAAFLRNGFCVIPLYPNKAARATLGETFDTWCDEVDTLFRGMIRAHECRAIDGRREVSLDEGYANFRQRGRGRFEMIHPSISEHVVGLVEKCETVQETLDVLLSAHKPLVTRKLMSSGCFLSLTGSDTQSYHTDGPALSDAVDLFPYAINVFVPLVDVDQKNGTEFIPRTQRPSQADQSSSVRPQVMRGHALLFDYRVVHRGVGNRTGEARPCFYATYSRNWYTDRYNFSRKRYRDDLEVSADMMLSRDERLRRRTH